MKETTLNGQSADIVSDNIQKLKQIFPEVFCEDSIDFEKLQAVLGEYADDNEERYNFTWWGKSRALRLAQTPSMGTLRPCKEESKDWDTTENLYIEGDNLEVLKLLQKSYHGKAKIIFIDPPYNTGNDFVYPDDFKDPLRNYLEMTEQVDEEGKKLATNSETSGRYHTNWLNMMYPRLRLARNILKDDGAIFICIDDNEVSNLKKVCDEIFGEENFITILVWNHTQQSKNDERFFSRHYNNIIVYSKSPNIENFLFERTEKDNKNYSNPDNDPEGDWRSGDVRSPNLRKTLKFIIKTPSGKIILPPEKGWRWSEESIQEKIAVGEIIFNEDETKIIRKIYLKDQVGRTPENIWSGEAFGTTRKANTEIKGLFDKTIFDTPKPSDLTLKIMELFHNEDDFIVFDFFSGSASTAHGVMRFNARKRSKHKFIMVQFPEPTDEKSEACKAGYENICEIGKERIRRAGEKIKAELREKQKGQSSILEENTSVNPDDLDIGFKVFKLDSSNLKKWNPDYENLEASLLDSVENFVEGRTELDVVYEIMLKYGIDLTLPLEEYEIGGKKIFSIGYGALMICLDQEITTEVANQIVRLKEELKPEVMRVVFKDNGFQDDSAKTNTKEILRNAGIEEIVSV